MTEELAKPQLHASDLRTLSMCPMRYFYRRVEGIIAPPGVALVVGSTVHRSVEHDMRTKLEEKKLADAEVLTDLAVEALKEKFKEGVALDEDEKKVGEKATRAEAEKKVVRLSLLHHDEAAPGIEPLYVERKWVIKMKGYPMDLAGQIDVQELDLSVDDAKTAGRTPPKTAADTSQQLTMYALATKVTDGKLPPKVRLHNLVDLKKPKLVTYESTRDEEDVTILLRRVQAAVQLIEKGVWFPCDPGDWCCSPRWCGYWDRCPYSKKPVSVAT